MKKIILIGMILILSMTTVFSVEMQLIVDGNNITKTAMPVIVDSRTMVPIKFIIDELGGQVSWNNDLKQVTIQKDGATIKLWTDSRLAEINGTFVVSDVAPTIINDRTYVPLKLISNTFGVQVSWEADTKTVTIDSSQKAQYTPYYDLDLSLEDGAKITGTKEIQANHDYAYYRSEILILDPVTAKGYVRAGDSGQKVTYVPRPEDQGQKVLVYALKNSKNELVAAKALKVTIDLEPEITLKGLSGGTYESLTLSPLMNFEPRYVDYKLVSTSTDQVFTITERDPYDDYLYTPEYKNNGQYKVSVIAYDSDGKAYESQPVTITLAAKKYLYLSGIKDGQKVNDTISLIAYRNFDVTKTEFFMVDEAGKTSLLSSQGYGSYEWQPDIQKGSRQFYVEVTDLSGKVHQSPLKTVQVDMTPTLTMHGIAPNQVLSSSADLYVTSNVDLEDVHFVITGPTNHQLSGLDGKATFIPNQSGDFEIYATAAYEGQVLKSQSVVFKTYTGPLYSAKPIVEKEGFQEFASALALESLETTGMSASLQTAQAILETGWGQKLPVDKYSGLFSYNLFGIKGSATNGSVISNTWEVYNGITYRIDGKFRAYNNVDESWADHKRILLELSRYAPYRDVMYDATKGAWAIRRCGYATDPKYPMKLIRIIDQYDLELLDQLTI